jgi:hypothetical protein
MINNTGNNIAAALIGLITSAIIGIDSMAIGTAKPPFEIPKRITPMEA